MRTTQRVPTPDYRPGVWPFDLEGDCPGIVGLPYPKCIQFNGTTSTVRLTNSGYISH